MSETDSAWAAQELTTRRRRGWLDALIVAVAGTALVLSLYELNRSGGDISIEIGEPALPMSAEKGELVQIRGVISGTGSRPIRVHGIAPC